jgi:hypothetical protein
MHMKPSRPLVETTPLPVGVTLAQLLPVPQEVPWTHPGNDIVVGYDEADRPVVLTYQDRARHVYIAGRTGTGKSRLLGSAIRQDIAQSRSTNCPVVVFDLHGELVNSVLNVLACDVQSHDLPIVYIDVTNRDAILTWNPLKRQASVDPAVSARLLAEAVMHASGKLDLMQAPTLQRTMTTFFHVGIERGLTLPQLFELADPSASALRAEIATSIGDVRTRADLERMNSITKQRLEEEMLALHNRLSGLTGTLWTHISTRSSTKTTSMSARNRLTRNDSWLTMQSPTQVTLHGVSMRGPQSFSN